MPAIEDAVRTRRPSDEHVRHPTSTTVRFPPRTPGPVSLVPHMDVTNALTVWLILLYGITAGLGLPGFGAFGQPATLFALGATLWWLAARMIPTLGLDECFQPVRVALMIYVTYVLGSFGLSGTRVLTELERTNSTRALLTTIGLFGIAALVADGVGSGSRLRTLLRRLTTIGALFALIGMLQVVAGETFHLVPPGLVWNTGTTATLGFRGGLIRPLSTGLHPIEYAVMVASLFPLAIHFALHPRTRNDRIRAIVEATLLLIAVPLSLSRTAVVSLVAAGIVLAFGWSWRHRLYGLFAGLLAVPAIAMLVPGAYRVMLGLFTGADADPSVQVRVARVPNIMALIRERPWFGMGHGTYTSTDYFLIDNQLWVTMISDGMVGLALTLGLFLTAGLMAVWSGSRPGATDESRHLGRAVAAGIAGIVASLATFDAFFYRILLFTLFLLIGCAGALWRLSGEAAAAAGTGFNPDPAPGAHPGRVRSPGTHPGRD